MRYYDICFERIAYSLLIWSVRSSLVALFFAKKSFVKPQHLRIIRPDASHCKYALRAKCSSAPDLPRILWFCTGGCLRHAKKKKKKREIPPLSTTYISMSRDSVCSAVRLNEAAYVSPTCSRADEENTAARRNIFTTVAGPLRTKCSEALGGLPASWWPALYNGPVCANICLRDPHPYTHA